MLREKIQKELDRHNEIHAGKIVPLSLRTSEKNTNPNFSQESEADMQRLHQMRLELEQWKSKTLQSND